MAYGLSPSDIKHVKVAATSDGDNTVVAAVAGKRIIVIGYSLRFFGAAGGEAVNIRSGAAADANTVHLAEICATTPGARASYAGSLDSPAFACEAGALLNASTAAGGDVFGHLTYIIV